MSLHNTNMKENWNIWEWMLSMARDYGRKIGFKGHSCWPEPMEPSKHQYDFDVATIIGFLKQHGLDKDFKLNIERSYHALRTYFPAWASGAADAGLLGVLMPIRWLPETDGIPMNSQQIFMRLLRQWWLYCNLADFQPEALISMLK